MHVCDFSVFQGSVIAYAVLYSVLNLFSKGNGNLLLHHAKKQPFQEGWEGIYFNLIRCWGYSRISAGGYLLTWSGSESVPGARFLLKASNLFGRHLHITFLIHFISTVNLTVAVCPFTFLLLLFLCFLPFVS